MAIRSRDTLKQWFETGDYPSQEQFWDWIDSFVHKNEDSGRRVYFGAGEPSVELGNNGDVFIDTEGSHSFYYKETGNWSLKGKMIEISTDDGNAAEIGTDGKIYVPVPDIPTLDDVLEAGNESEREIKVPYLKVVDGEGYAWYGLGSVYGGSTGGVRANVNTVSYRNASNGMEAILYYQGSTIRTILIPDRTGTMAVLLDAFTLSDATWSSSKINTEINAAKSYAESLVVGLWDDRGNFDASGGAYPSSGGSGAGGAIKKGDIWTISVLGTLPTDQVVEPGDTVRALVDTPGNTQANWSIQQNNIGYTPENVSNKDTDGTFAANSDTKYPSQKAAKTYVDTSIGTKEDKTSATTGNVISFATPQVYNSIASPGSGDITDNLTGARVGVIQKIYHNKLVAPTFPAGWVRLGSTTYNAGNNNIIFAEWVSGTRVEYWIVRL